MEKWSMSSAHVYFDVMNNAMEHEDEEGKLWLLPHDTVIPVENRVLWRLLEFDAADGTGYIAPIQADAVIEAVMNGELPPLHECEEEDAWQFRRDFRDVAGYVDEQGNKVSSAEPKRSNLQMEQERSERPYTPIDEDNLPF